MAATPPEPVVEPGFTRWPWYRRWFGRRSERAAARYLRSLRFRVLAANVSDPTGELDLLALDGETLVVVEVRSTASDRENALEETAASVDLRKQRKITGATLRFLATRKLLGKIAVRFDVLAMSWPAHAREPVVKHIRHAFEATGKFQFFS
ncbi:MAG: YraN family protein [Planctomycetes bacterium]|nr:YraN family protein [Planctomycetota bacterium]